MYDGHDRLALAGLVCQKIEHATGVHYGADVVAEILLFDPEFESFVDCLARKPVPVDESPAREETLIERARRMLDELADATYTDRTNTGA